MFNTYFLTDQTHFLGVCGADRIDFHKKKIKKKLNNQNIMVDVL